MTAIPVFIEPDDLTKLSHDDLTQLVETIAEKRLRAFVVYSEAQEILSEARETRQREKLKQATDMLFKELTKLDKYLERLGDRVRKVQVMRLEMGVDPGKGMEDDGGVSESEGH